jgi:hypothetical protein
VTFKVVDDESLDDEIVVALPSGITAKLENIIY